MNMLTSKKGSFLIPALLIIANLAFAINQFNFASIYSLIAKGFHQNVSGLGSATSLYFLAIALVEIPGGIVSVKVGPKKMVLAGTILSFSSNLLSAFLPQFNMIIASRAVAGIGNGLAFPSLLVVLARNFRRGSEALSVGLVNGAFNLGGIVGLFGWAVIGTITGWRISVLIGGLLGLSSSVPLFFILPDDALKSDFRIRIEQLTSVIFRREVIVIILPLFAIAAGASVSWGFLVYYLEGTLDVGPELAGLAGSLSLVFALVVSPIIGRRYDKFGNTRNWVFIAGTITAVGIAFASIHSLYFAMISSAIVGIGFGVGFTVGLSAARDLCSANIEYESMAVSLVDGLSVFGGFFAPLLFAAIVVSSGYPLGWLLAGLFGFLLTLPIVTMKKQKMGVWAEH
jgi:MFS family permease